MRRTLLPHRSLQGGLSRHRPRTPGWSRADADRARGTDIALAVIGLFWLGSFCLLVAARAIGL